MEGVIQLNNFEEYKKAYENAIFFVERDMDDHLVVYQARKTEDHKRIKGINIFWSSSTNTDKEEEMSQKVKDNIFGIDVISKKPFGFTVKAFDDKIIECHVRESTKVTTKCIINGKECKLIKIFVKVTRMPPAIKEIIVYGTFNNVLESESLEIPPYSSMMSLIFG
jgi:hypothetical protein